MPPFRASGAFLIYEKEEDLGGVKTFNGVVGCDEICLEFGHGDEHNLKIEGSLDTPMCPAISVCGSLFFTQS